MTKFVSDNVAGIHPQILAAIGVANEGFVLPYGNDEYSQKLDERFSEIFETKVSVLPCSSGTAANSIALSLLASPINAVCVHEKAHVYVDECNAPELFTGGCRLTPIRGLSAKIEPHRFELEFLNLGQLHSPQPSAISLTQSTEEGTVYSLDELRRLSTMAHTHGLKVHMDGARFANALVGLKCSPADMTWRSGVDVLSFGATKNGAMAAEAVVIFDDTIAKDAKYRHKRAAQLLSKNRFLATQLLSYLDDDLWLNNALHANTMMRRLCESIAAINGVKVPDDIDSNMVFVSFTPEQIERLQADNLAGYVYPDGRMRLCCSWATREDHIEQFIGCLNV